MEPTGAFSGFEQVFRILTDALASVLFFDIGGIYSLAMASRDAPIFIMLLFFGLFITFGGISLGIGIMNLGGFSDNDRYEDERKSHRNDGNDGRGE